MFQTQPYMELLVSFTTMYILGTNVNVHTLIIFSYMYMYTLLYMYYQLNIHVDSILESNHVTTFINNFIVET